MPIRSCIFAALLALPPVLAGCGGVVYDTTVADTAEVRRAMVESVRIGATTETAFVTRWGPPLQKVQEGARTEFIYRRMGDSTRFVIVTFDHGQASGVRSTETEACRATFAPRVPGYGFDRPDIAQPVGFCGAAQRPGVDADDYRPAGSPLK